MTRVKGKWQPIATAPKDGTGILAYQNGNMRVCCWTTCGWAFYQSSKIGAPVVVMLAPTHWQPLPAPPEPLMAQLQKSLGIQKP